jgi:hypothetical protein
MAGCCPCSVFGTCGCPAVPARWRFTVAGIVNAVGGNCVNCAGFNGDWVLTIDNTFPEYTWLAPANTNPCVLTQPAWQFQCVSANPATAWILSIGNSGAAGGVVDEWALPLGGLNCLGVNVLPHTQAGGAGGCDASAVGAITLIPA